ncbi:MAG: nucleotidyl transferase AbiEii/AbiGii toxin family protein [Clostridia bacterium]|nr:nucleotidyl transferase AbiEii/AbiGii toxin family protein [Clostridia bacterium]
MKLHEEKETFKKLIKITSDYYNYNEAIIEKDYYVMLILEEIVKKFPDIVFKGGTSLSKGHKIINRFSEDIDLTFENHPGDSKRKRVKHEIVNLINDMGFNIINEDDLKGNRDFNKYLIEYPKVTEMGGIKKVVQVETSYIMPGYPNDKKEISSYIYEYMNEKGLVEDIKKYELKKFEVNIQTIERTFIDKVFALCDYVLSNDIDEHSRHIYDLYKLYPLIKFDKDFKMLVEDIRQKRRKHKTCISAKEGININKILRDVIDKEIYKIDYAGITSKILSMEDQIKYEEAITVLDRIANDGHFE